VPRLQLILDVGAKHDSRRQSRQTIPLNQINMLGTEHSWMDWPTLPLRVAYFGQYWNAMFD
jgi:hypothetical protein